MKLLLTLICIFCTFFSKKTFGQQDPHFTQYMFNTMSINPAYAGSRGQPVITALARKQLVGFKGGPNTQNLSYDSPLGSSGLGVGVNLMNDKIGPSNEIYFDFNLSYVIKTSDLGKLSLGLRLGGRILNIDWSLGSVIEDESLFENNISGKFLPTVGTGLYYYNESWYIGLSVPNILKSEHYDAVLEREAITAVEKIHFFLISGYVFDLNESVKFKPSALLKFVSGTPLSLDVSANFLLDNKYRAGIAWRWGDSISTLFAFQITESFLLGYAYDLTTSNYNIANSGTHEVMLRYELLDLLNFRSPRFF